MTKKQQEDLFPEEKELATVTMSTQNYNILAYDVEPEVATQTPFHVYVLSYYSKEGVGEYESTEFGGFKVKVTAKDEDTST